MGRLQPGRIAANLFPDDLWSQVFLPTMYGGVGFLLPTMERAAAFVATHDARAVAAESVSRRFGAEWRAKGIPFNYWAYQDQRKRNKRDQR